MLEPIGSELHIIVVGHVEDADGDESEVWLGLRDVAVKLDADITEDYARFECDRIEDFRG